MCEIMSFKDEEEIRLRGIAIPSFLFGLVLTALCFKFPIITPFIFFFFMYLPYFAGAKNDDDVVFSQGIFFFASFLVLLLWLFVGGW